MISRRNIRIKVFQTIYELGQQFDEVQSDKALKLLDNKLNETSALLAASVHLTYLLCEYVLIYSNQKASKFITTADDLNINKKLAGNLIIQQLKKNTHFADSIKEHKISSMFEDEFIRKLFLELIETPDYKNYISKEDRNSSEEKSIFLFILEKIIYQNEYASTFLSEQYQCWYNDADMIQSWFEKLSNTAANFNFGKIISPDKLEFAKDLIVAYYDKKDIVFHLIEPKLVNWDAERVALIDLILLHLGICEMMFFKTIPVKVTINEYIDLAKSYSTLQSGQFVNGLLDSVHKDLAKENKLFKETFTKK
ncbi:MAG: transcription antitermination factor NusB [Bacteroidetes bacterium]|nr:transcription antitermination factor NusB [Bacteroidota bacterium]